MMVPPPPPLQLRAAPGQSLTPGRRRDHAQSQGQSPGLSLVREVPRVAVGVLHRTGGGVVTRGPQRDEGLCVGNAIWYMYLCDVWLLMLCPPLYMSVYRSRSRSRSPKRRSPPRRRSYRSPPRRRRYSCVYTLACSIM